MDFLKEAISQEVRKRKNLYKRAREDEHNTNNNDEGLSSESTQRKHTKKYVRVADLNSTSDIDPESTAAAAAAADKQHQSSQSQSHNSTAADSSKYVLRKNRGQEATSDQARSQSIKDDDGDGDEENGKSLGTMSADEVIKRLRARGEPIRLFGETDGQRRKRLRHLELSEEKRASGQQNEFRRVLAQVEAGTMLEDLKRQARMGDDEKEKRQNKYQMLLDYDVSDISPYLLRTDIDRLHTLLYVYLKRLLYEWDDYLATRADDDRRSAEGKLAAATQRQSAEYLKPLFRNLKSRKVPADVLARITEIARNLLDREYMKANDAYLQLSVGNAPWPIGVTQVGIHARAARENINANKVAHVLNNEVQRKWIQSLKRLMRFAQTKYPPTDLAKMMG
ncbi:hypothetical protein IW140_001411 [Coemansia sp. RSA 1813]|nr:hypothetical protein EV178_001057 [Coemansia sp. RSA 1646]KAJ1772202.1 hypothetical protein LPJ74_001632 [Coemansia sp. RSA 1843]KAJ2091834.1 hypothetical protein IW138_001523 [Coemansia sp. RSA 986]KAJ2215839.1 hypothetical protein EV179_001859 [Coemansia sp. RSA 487]KAJ2571770.1 hypothetical protein IW140_001411 [Coemansia sp. RSA 1813]